VLHTYESTTGPVVVDGRTIALVAKTRALSLGRTSGSLFHVRSRPAHVEVLDGDGRRRVLPIRDVQRLVMSAIVAVTVAGVVLRRARREAAS